MSMIDPGALLRSAAYTIVTCTSGAASMDKFLDGMLIGLGIGVGLLITLLIAKIVTAVV